MLATNQNPILFCKPFNATSTDNMLYQVQSPDYGCFTIRSLDLEKDLDMIHDWVNRDYSEKFWQLKGARGMVRNLYQSILDNPDGHSFIGLINDEPICQIDLYKVVADELSQHIVASPHDCGMHLLMAPVQVKKSGITLFVLKAFLQYYFSFPEARRMYGEPDQENHNANKLVQQAGFRYLKNITLSYKKANLYCITREEL